MRISLVLTIALVAAVSGCSLMTHASAGGSASGGSPAASLPGNVTATCKPVWTYGSSNGTPVFGTYAAAYKADAAEMAARYPNPVVPGNTGLRVAEVMALRPSDVNLSKHSIRVLHGKGDKATTRGFHPSIQSDLARWLDTRKELGIKGGPLFCTLDGGKIHEQYARNLIKRLGAKAGIEKRVHPHGLRHILSA